MQGNGRFSKLKTLAGRVLRRGPVGPGRPVRSVPAIVPVNGGCTARWCLAHDDHAAPQPQVKAEEPPDRLQALPAPTPQPG